MALICFGNSPTQSFLGIACKSSLFYYVNLKQKSNKTNFIILLLNVSRWHKKIDNFCKSNKYFLYFLVTHGLSEVLQVANSFLVNLALILLIIWSIFICLKYFLHAYNAMIIEWS